DGYGRFEPGPFALDQDGHLPPGNRACPRSQLNLGVRAAAVQSAQHIEETLLDHILDPILGPPAAQAASHLAHEARTEFLAEAAEHLDIPSACLLEQGKEFHPVMAAGCGSGGYLCPPGRRLATERCLRTGGGNRRLARSCKEMRWVTDRSWGGEFAPAHSCRGSCRQRS